MSKEILQRLRQGVLAGDEKIVKETAEEAIEKGLDPIEITEALTAGVREVGEKFGRMEVFLAEMMMSAEAMRTGMKVVAPRLSKEKAVRRGTAVLGTVKGDIHEIGKNILGALLSAAGFEVHDLGPDVSASTFVRKAEEVRADVIAASALMTTTLLGQRDILEYLIFSGGRDKHVVLVGGSPASAEWAREIGADGYGETAVDGVQLSLKALEQKRKKQIA